MPDIDEIKGKPIRSGGGLVVSVAPGSPAARKGLQRGDVIIEIDDKSARARLFSLEKDGYTTLRFDAADINAAAERTATETTPTAPADASEVEAPVAEVEEPTIIPSPTAGPVETSPTAAPLTNPRVEVPDVFVNWLLPWDGIRPIYDPQFASAAEAALDDDELVIGISIDGEAKAYPISVLRFREMVNDELAGVPTLVTW